MRTLILIEAPDDDWSVKAFRDNGFNVGIIFKRINKGLRAVRREWVLKGFPHKDIWYGDWKYCLEKFDQIIFFVNSLCLELPLFLNKVAPGKRVIAWYWNSVDESIDPRKLKGKCEKWSFDPENCQKYNMQFNHQFYFNSLVKQESTLEYDVYFCGTDSGRGIEIARIYNALIERKLKLKFQVVNPKCKDIPNNIISSRVPYDDILNNLSKSKAILEIVRQGQSGCTIRTMEALFNGKKLITNNTSIKNEPFYNSNDIFVIDVDNIDKINDFLKSPHTILNDFNQYDVTQWVERFK